MRRFTVLGLLFVLLSFLPAALSAREYPSTSNVSPVAYYGNRDGRYERWRHHRRHRHHRHHRYYR